MRRFNKSKATKAQLAYLRQTEKGARKIHRAFSSSLKKLFLELGKEISAIAVNTITFRRDFAEQPFVDLVLDAFAFSKWQATNFDPLWAKTYLNMAELTYGALQDHYGVDIGVGLPDVVSAAALAAGGRNLGLLDLRGDTKDALFKVLAEAKDANLGPVETGRLIRDFVGAGRFTGLEAVRSGSGVEARAEQIARTEIRSAQAVSVAEAGHEAGFEEFMAFDNLSGFDDDECIARDGNIYSYDDMLSEDEAEHPNGTLSWAPVPGSQVVEE